MPRGRTARLTRGVVFGGRLLQRRSLSLLLASKRSLLLAHIEERCHVLYTDNNVLPVGHPAFDVLAALRADHNIPSLPGRFDVALRPCVREHVGVQRRVDQDRLVRSDGAEQALGKGIARPN